MECKQIKENGEPCKTPARKKDDRCFFHSNKVSEKMKQQARSRGGKVVKILATENLQPIKIEGTIDVTLLLVDVINKTRSGNMDIKVANTIGFLSGHLLRAFQDSTIEQRISKIEELLLSREVN